MNENYMAVIKRMMHLDILRRAYLQKAAQENGLYFGQLPILKCICSKANCTQREIADTLGVTPASIALSTKRMQKAGLLEKRIDSQDLRCNQLTLTDKGVAYMKACSAKFDELDQIIFRDFSEEELTAATAVLEKMLNNLLSEMSLPENTDFFRLASRLKEEARQVSTD